MKSLKKNICLILLLVLTSNALASSTVDARTTYKKIISFAKKHPYTIVGSSLLLLVLFKYFFYEKLLITEKQKVLRLFPNSHKQAKEVTTDADRKTIEDILNNTEGGELDFEAFSKALQAEKGQWNNFPYTEFFNYFLSNNNPRQASFGDFFDACLKNIAILDIVNFIHGLYQECYQENGTTFKLHCSDTVVTCFEKLIRNETIFSNDSSLTEEQRARILFSYIRLQIAEYGKDDWSNGKFRKELKNTITLLVNRNMFALFSVVHKQCGSKYDLISPLLDEYNKIEDEEKKEKILTACRTIITEGVGRKDIIDHYYNYWHQQPLYHYIYPFLTLYPLQNNSIDNQKNILDCFLQNISCLKKLMFFINVILGANDDTPYKDKCSVITQNNIYFILNALCKDLYFPQLYEYLKTKPTKDYHKYNRNLIAEFIVSSNGEGDPEKFHIWRQVITPLLKKIVETLIIDHSKGSHIVCNIIKEHIRYSWNPLGDSENIFSIIKEAFSQSNPSNINQDHKRELSLSLLKAAKSSVLTQEKNKIYAIFDELFELFPEYESEFYEELLKDNFNANYPEKNKVGLLLINQYLQGYKNRQLLHLNQNYNLLIDTFTNEQEWINAYNQLHVTIESNPHLEALLHCFSIDTIHSIISHEYNQNRDHEAIFNYFKNMLERDGIDVQIKIDILDFFAKHASPQEFLRNFFTNKNNSTSYIDALISSIKQYHGGYCQKKENILTYVHSIVKHYKQHSAKEEFWKQFDTICCQFSNALKYEIAASSFYQKVFLPLEYDQDDLYCLQDLASKKQIGNIVNVLKKSLVENVNYYRDDKIFKWIEENNSDRARQFMSLIYTIDRDLYYAYAASLFINAKDSYLSEQLLTILKNDDQFHEFAHLFIQKKNNHHENMVCSYKQFKILFNKKLVSLENHIISQTLCTVIKTNYHVAEHIKNLGILNQYDLSASYPHIQDDVLKKIIMHKQKNYETIKQTYKKDGAKLYIFGEKMKTDQRKLGFYTDKEHFDQSFCQEINNNLCKEFLQYMYTYGLDQTCKKNRELFFYVSLNSFLLKKKYEENRAQAISFFKQIAPQCTTSNEKKCTVHLASYLNTFTKNPNPLEFYTSWKDELNQEKLIIEHDINPSIINILEKKIEKTQQQNNQT